MNILIYFAEVLGAVAAVVTAFSILYVKVIKPIKKVLEDVKLEKRQIEFLQKELIAVNKAITDSNDYDTENRAITMKSLIAILDGLEQAGANGVVTTTKKELINYMTKNLTGKK